MPRRPKIRIEHLADALVATEEAWGSLDRIDLRSCPHTLRDEIKAAREALDDARISLTEALAMDVPQPPRR